eukprot:129173-Chlamydomonas_euryale.AAC.2
MSDAVLNEVVERMYGVSFRKGSVVLRQGDSPKEDDCMYYVQGGEAQGGARDLIFCAVLLSLRIWVVKPACKWRGLANAFSSSQRPTPTLSFLLEGCAGRMAGGGEG